MTPIVALTVVGAFNHRGLYLPKEEIELAFSSPISRGDLIRYRLFVNLGKSLFAGILFGLATAAKLPGHAFAFVGVFVTMLSIPVLHELGALSFGVLLVLVAGLGVFLAPYFAAQRLVLPELVGDDERVVANGRLYEMNQLINGASAPKVTAER